MEATFNRGLSPEFVEALNDEYAKNGWWRAMVDDTDLFVAIRDDRVNVYYRGCSLADVWMESGQVVGQTHYKYLLRPWVEPAYIRFDEGKYDQRDDVDLFVESPKEVRELKAAARPHAGEEKTGVHGIVGANSNILDVEIAFRRRGTEESNPSSPRVDFAAVRESNGGGEVVFFEAKRFANRSALRAEGSKQPDVIAQIEGYSRLLHENRKKVVKSYACVCSNLLDLHGMRERDVERHRLLERIANKPMSIDENVRLVVFGFDNDQKGGAAWERHIRPLCVLLGEDRVLLKGETKDFRRGISTK